ncbi:MAG TPA: hypothetical protein VJN18_11545 [Polyangiaceae bacterium]|nr:hypothetical protein [Polyangiaceae bacterium]
MRSLVYLYLCFSFGFVSGCSSNKEKPKLGLEVNDERVRACDVLFESGSQLDVHFDESVVGRIAQRNGRWAMSFAARADAPLRAVARQIEGPRPKLLTQTCYDRVGRKLPSEPVSLQ